MTLDVTVVIPAFHRPQLLEKAVRSVLAQTMAADRYEVIVVDSSGNDVNANLVRALEKHSPCSLQLFTKDPEGPGPSRMLGARHARGRIVAFMDSDCQASAQWLEAGVTAFDEETGLVQGRTMPEPGAKQNVFNRSFTIERENFIYEAMNIFYRRDVILDLGGFRGAEDPTAMRILGGEDVDLAWRVKRAGWRSRFESRALVHHVVERITPWEWLYNPRMTVIPKIPRDFPETRKYFFARYFFDDVQAYLVLGLLCAGLSPYSPLFWLGAAPYFIRRGSEQTRALAGVLRPVRAVVYFPRDFLTLLALIRGSIRHRSLLL